MQINVKKLMNQLLEMVNHDVKEFSDLTADSMGYFVQLNELLNETPKRTIGKKFIYVNPCNDLTSFWFTNSS